MEVDLHVSDEISDMCDLIQKTILKRHNITEEDFRSKKRDYDIALARHLIFFFQVYFTEATLKYVGLRCGCRDHSTVIHGKLRIADEIDMNGLMIVIAKESGREIFKDDFEKKWQEYEYLRIAERKIQDEKRKFQYKWDMKMKKFL